MSFSLDFIKGKKKFIIVIVAFAAASAITRLLVPVYIGDSVGIIEGGEYSLVSHFLILILIVSAVTSLSQFFLNYLSQYVAQNYAKSLRTSLLHKLLLKKPVYIEDKTSGDLLARSTMDIEASRNFVLNTTTTLITTLLLILIGLYMLLTLNPVYAVLFAFTVPFLVYTGMIFQRKQRLHWRKIRNYYGMMNERLQENITGQRVVRGFQGAQTEEERFNESTKNYFDEYMEVAALRGFYNNIMPLSVGVAATAVILYGGFVDIISGQSVGNLVAAVNIFIMVSGPVGFFGRIIVFSENARASIARIKEVINNVDEEDLTKGISGWNPSSSRLTLEQVSFERAGRKILTNVNLDIRSGDIVALSGRVGAGKTTLISLIARLFEPKNGTIKIDDVPIDRIPLLDLRSTVAIVPQTMNLLSGNIFDNITFGRKFSLEDVRSAARIAEIADFVEGLENGYSTLVGERGLTLSGGQKQRVLVARAVIGKPRILILDDSTSSVDPEAEMKILRNIRNELTGTTILIVSHRPSVTKFAKRIFLLEEGNLSEITATSPEYLARGSGLNGPGGDQIG
ncbi:MAG: ABC transporter ATP-binding protein/permease [Candidatus Thermoplasmatota archaeon]|nr:ABC transporter ATP-binding protein/permease [Candidatus Thermoplasmatota archaeon]